MKKLLVLAVALSFLAGLGAGDGWADAVFPNNTLVESYISGNPPGAYNSASIGDSTYRQTDASGHTWYDSIGTSNFETYGGNLVGSTLYLYTKFGGANATDTLNGTTITVADLFIDTNRDGIVDYRRAYERQLCSGR